MKKTKKITTIILITTIFLCSIALTSKADVNTDKFKPGTNGPTHNDILQVANIVNPIIGTIQVVGIVLAVIILIIIGLKYMTGSVSEKAEYKKTIIPYIIGIFFIVGITQIIALIIKLVSGIN